MATTLRSEPRHQLQSIVPGYVWQQPRFSIDWEAARQVVTLGQGIVLVKSPSLSRREYALASFLALLLRHNYYADVGWTSFYHRYVSDFTSAYTMPEHRALQAISVKERLDDAGQEQVLDLAVSCRVAVIAADTYFELQAPHVLIQLSAREDVDNYQESTARAQNKKL